MEKYKNQHAYYWRHREEILGKLAKKRKSAEYRKKRAAISLKSYYKRKEEKCQNKKPSLMTDAGNTK